MDTNVWLFEGITIPDYTKNFSKVLSYLEKNIKSYRVWYLAVNIKRVLFSVRKLVDVGCGPGPLMFILKSETPRYDRPSFYRIGLDIDYYSLVIAKRVYDDVVQASATHLPFRCKVFDLSLEIGLIYLLPSLKHKILTLREMDRVSRCILLVEGNNSNFRKLLKTLMLKHELRKPTIEEIKNWIKYINIKRHKIIYFDVALHQRLLRNKRLIGTLEVFISKIPLIRRVLSTFIIALLITS